MNDALLHFQGELCNTYCFTIMPNHVHAVVKPLDCELEEWLYSVKRFVATRTNQLLSRTGQLWQEESYDRIIRDPEHLYRVVEYIGRNPSKASLARSEWHRWLHPNWIAAGWEFAT